jgi:hypothetical protein
VITLTVWQFALLTALSIVGLAALLVVLSAFVQSWRGDL